MPRPAIRERADATAQPAPAPAALEETLARIRACRLCAGEIPAPRPVLQASATARLCIVGQAPGTRVHASGRPFTDPSGERLRAWLGIGPEVFYDARRVAVVPMGFCFPGLDAKGGDRPPRALCARTWRRELFALLPRFRLVLLIGAHAQTWHLGDDAKPTLTETVAAWRTYGPHIMPLPHPSWRNNAWLKRHPWFETELLPNLRTRVAASLAR